jgi:serine/threonine-protein kinase
MVTSNVRLVRPLGEGGMGSVWVAEHLSLRTSVVVKFMAKELADSPDAIARFSREAAAASQVKSPHVVQMLDHGFLEGGPPYIVMELLEGTDLEHHIKDNGGRLPPSEVVTVVLQLARALGKAHTSGIVHRDIKPSNVFLLDAGGGEVFVKLLDFGIAKGQAVNIQGSTTRSGTFVGSPFYMSPEQVVGARDIDFRSDLWSLGVLAFEALVGRKPFVADTLGALALKIHRDPMPVPTAHQPDLPPALDVWFGKACAREPGDRFASAREMADALAAALLGEAAAPANDGRSDGRAKDGTNTPDGARTPRAGDGPQQDVAKEPHALAATLRSDDRSRAGPRAAGTAKWIAAITLIVGGGVVIAIAGLDGRGKKGDEKAQAATLVVQPPAISVASAPANPMASAPPTAVGSAPASTASTSALAVSPEPTPAAPSASSPTSLVPAHADRPGVRGSPVVAASLHPHVPAASATRPTSSASPPSDPDGIK